MITPTKVEVRSGRDPVGRTFLRDSVESRLEEFLQFLDSLRASALPDIVPFLVEEFRKTWAASSHSTGQDALVAFLFALHAAGHSDPGILDDPTWRHDIARDIGIDDPSLADAVVSGGATIERARAMQTRAPLGLRLVPSLILRHAAGRLFQEAHAIVESTQLGLFGDPSITTIPTYSPTGAYFTPVPIARLLTDWALQRWPALPDDLTIADFACGSAVFLTEALRTLERLGFQGKVRLIGRDKSAQAIAMAKVAIRTVQKDMPAMRITSDIVQADALKASWPKADIVLMNPPFRSWERMSSSEREWVHEVTKGVGRGRTDLSVGFIDRAIQALQPSGVLATLVPAGVLASDSLSNWRNGLLDKATPTLVAVFGEHGLFEHALVNVGILALQNNPSLSGASKKQLYVAWSSAETGTASRAIRAIRRSMSEPSDLNRRMNVSEWSVNVTNLDAWKKRPSWLPGTGALGPLLETIQENIGTKVSDIFHVRQGIRTGANKAFLHPAAMVEKLPARERRYFKEAVDTASFDNGEVKSQKYLFVPDRTWETESALKEAVPQFFERQLGIRKQSLKERRSRRKSPWWGLSERRGWMFDGRPRLISKSFGLYPAFARDFEGQLAIVQANAWIPTSALGDNGDDDALREVLTGYWWLLNSRIAVALFREYCPNVAGGQLDLQHKYVKHVPMPNLKRQFEENPGLQVLASSIRTRNTDYLPKISDRDQFAAAAFGTDVSDWNLSGVELPD